MVWRRADRSREQERDLSWRKQAVRNSLRATALLGFRSNTRSRLTAPRRSPAAVRDRRDVRPFGQAGGAAAPGGGPQVPRDRRRQFRRPHEVDQAASGVQVPNTLTGEGNVAVDITFESMDDFSPAAVAKKVDSAGQAARGADPTDQPAHLHGRQERRRRPDHQGAAGSRAAADAGVGAQAPQTPPSATEE